MKKVFYIVFILPLILMGQTDTENYSYTKSYTVKTVNGTTTTGGSPISTDQKIESVVYYDGLGRPKQEIAVRQGGDTQDIIKLYDYNNIGRQDKDYLPYTIPSLSGEIHSSAPTVFDPNIPTLFEIQADFYNIPKYENTLNPYGEKVFEASPFDRVLEQAAPGEDWALIDGHTIKYGYQTNVANEVHQFSVTHPEGNTENTTLVYDGPYQPNQLYKTVTKDENWTLTDGNNHTTEEFKDKQGRTILKRTYNDDQAHDTHYVYDDFGNLTYVIPPSASDGILKTVYVYEEQESRVASQTNYPWTDLVLVDKAFAESYNKKLADYENEAILNADIQNEYGGQGGFTVATLNDSDLVTLSLNFAATNALELKQGELLSLEPYGKFKDTELGRISGNGYGYVFTIKNNAIYIEGNGKLSSANQTLDSDIKLSYSEDYLWTTYTDVDPKFASSFEKAVAEQAKINNQSILSVNLSNEFGGQGGLNVSIDENDNIALTFNGSATTALKLKQGAVITLDTGRKLQDRALGTISGTGFSYTLTLENNSIIIKGQGTLTSFNGYLLGPPPPPPTTEIVIDQTTVQGLCYIYHYDHRNRLIEKKIPGKGWEHIVYDNLNRPILTQDANLRLQDKWLFTKYDAFSRVAYTGLHTYEPVNYGENSGRMELQYGVENQTDPKWFETKSEYATTDGSNTVDGISLEYTHQSFPTTNLELLTIAYYDDYQVHDIEGLSYMDSYGQTLTANAKTLPTVTKVRVLGTDDWITTATYYDEKARSIFTISKNEYLNTVDWGKTKLDFVGKVIEATTNHQKTGHPTITTVDAYTYDHAQRLLAQTQTINGGTPELIVKNTYDELGQLVAKDVGNTETAPLQTVDYGYNIRGWLKTINNGDTAGDDLFGFKLNYNGPEHSGVTPLYNGNISETHWQTASDGNPRSYGYSYDALNRIKAAGYHGNYALAGNPSETEDYGLGMVNYDKNGNITYLNRTGLLLPSNEIDYIDDLVYDYLPKSNTLMGVSDSASEDGFKDGNTTGNDYLYDVNGNMTVDKNKNIVAIGYNHLNLPTSIQFDNTSPVPDGSISYVYDATGTKLEKRVSLEGSGITATQYAGNYIYENRTTIIPGGSTSTSELKFFNHPEGYVEPDGQGNFDYIYQYKDHLGNIRLSYKLDGMDVEMDNFNDGTTGSWGAHSSTISNEDDQLKVTLSDAEVGVFKVISVTAGEALTINLDLEMDTTDKVSLYEYGTGKLSDLVEGDNEINYTPTVSGDFILLIVKDPTSIDVGVQTIFYLDNIGVTVGEDELVIVEENNFYPFGLKHKGYNNVINGTDHKYGFGGKEEQDELGLGWLDITARNYDPALGRWMNLDPLAELMRRHSPYNYAFDNPIYFIDADGMMPSPPTDYYNISGEKIGTDGVSDGRKAVVTNGGEARQINRNDKKGETTQLSSVSSAKVLPSDTALKTSMDVLNDTKSVTASDNTGGMHGESALVFNDGTIARGDSGSRGTVEADGTFTTNEDLPNLPDGKTVGDIEVTIHGHATGAFEQDGKIYGGDATLPSSTDNGNSTFMNNTSIITGPLGKPTGATVFNRGTGKMQTQISQKGNGIVIYKGGTEQLRLTEKAVQNIIKN